MIFINDVLESIIIYLSLFLVTKYVFLEKGIEGSKGLKFNTYAIIGLVLANIIGNKGLAISLANILIMAWIIAGRKERRIVGIFLMMPISGIVDALVLPFAVMPQVIFDISDKTYAFYKLAIYLVLLFGLMFLFLRLNGQSKQELKNIDEKLGSNMDLSSHNRKLSKIEFFLLCFIGLFEMMFSLMVDREFNRILEWNISVDFLIKVFTAIFGMSVFTMTIIVIILVMSGNKRTYYHDKISDMQFNIIVTMAEIVENRDADTGGHIHRTAKYVDIIANQLRKDSPYKEYMTDQFINDIKVAAPLHDIGKIHVSDTILNFPGRLSEEDFKIMKTHAEEGRKLLVHTKQHIGEFSYLDMAIDMAGYHHEWWDGSAKGYPEHKEGEDIPLCARIMAVADVFDALTAKRVYKQPMPAEKAISIILEEKGTHFDPVVVDAFMAAIEHIKAALAEFESGNLEKCMH